jgi:hypothetical protein
MGDVVEIEIVTSDPTLSAKRSLSGSASIEFFISQAKQIAARTQIGLDAKGNLVIAEIEEEFDEIFRPRIPPIKRKTGGSSSRTSVELTLLNINESSYEGYGLKKQQQTIQFEDQKPIRISAILLSEAKTPEPEVVVESATYVGKTRYKFIESKMLVSTGDDDSDENLPTVRIEGYRVKSR